MHLNLTRVKIGNPMGGGRRTNTVDQTSIYMRVIPKRTQQGTLRERANPHTTKVPYAVPNFIHVLCLNVTKFRNFDNKKNPFLCNICYIEIHNIHYNIFTIYDTYI